jgi:Flp pilus assembly protein TadG
MPISRKLLGSFSPAVVALSKDRSGNVALLFALSIAPILVMVGAAVDYGRASSARERMQAGVDAAVLALAAEPGLAKAEMDAKADTIVRNALKAASAVVVDTVSATKEGTRYTVVTSARARNAFVGPLGSSHIPLSAQATAETAGGKPIEVALVLDTTGSMNEAGKLAALKQSARNFLAFLDKSVTSRDQAKVALVPFATQVNVGTAVTSASWLSYDPTGSTTGQKTTASTWKGCITDRNKPHNTALPDAPTGAAAYWADTCDASAQTKVMALGTDYHALGQAIDAMVAAGNTNTGIGMAWGLEALTPGGPLASGTPLGDKGVDKIIILLTDGQNTEDRYDRPSCFLIFCSPANVANLNARTLANCSVAKAAGIRVYTVRLIDGDEGLLRSCASEASFFYDVLKAEDLAPAFKSIGSAILAVRITS